MALKLTMVIDCDEWTSEDSGMRVDLQDAILMYTGQVYAALCRDVTHGLVDVVMEYTAATSPRVRVRQIILTPAL